MPQHDESRKPQLTPKDPPEKPRVKRDIEPQIEGVEDVEDDGRVTERNPRLDDDGEDKR